MLNYDTQGGSSVPSTKKTVADTTASLLVTDTVPVKDGYTFQGWAETSGGPVAYKAGGSVPMAWEEGKGSTADPVSKTLYAVWKENEPIVPDLTYTVIYTDGVAGETVFPDQGYEGLREGDDTPEFEGTPSREGYTFMGWELTTNKDKEGVQPEVLAEDANERNEIIYTATWEKDEDPKKDANYKVEWYVVGVEKPFKDETRSGKVGETVSVTEADKNVEGYTFVSDCEDNVLSATLAESGTVLKLYFTKNEEKPDKPEDPKKDATYTVVHAYYTNNVKDGETREAVTGKKVGDTVNAGDIAKITAYGGNTYTFTSADPATLVLADGENIITLRYDRTVTPPDDDDDDDDDDPYIPPVREPEIPDEQPPREETPVTDIPDTDTPQVDAPEVPDTPVDQEILDEEIPLDYAPQTGDLRCGGLWAMMSLLSLLGMIVLRGKKEEDA